MDDSYRKKVLDGFAWEAISKVFIQILSWFSTIIVARLLMPTDYGLVLISGLFTGLLTMIASLGISSGVVYRDDISKEELSTVFWLSILVGVLFYLPLYFLSGLIADLYNAPELTDILKVAGLMILLSSANIVPHAMMMRALNFRFAAIVDMLSKLILIGSTLYMAYSGYGYWALITSTVIAQGFIFITYLIFMKDRPMLSFDLSTVHDILKFGLTVLSSRLLMWWNNTSASAIVSVLFTKATSGHLQMALTLANIPLTKIGEIFDKIAFPAIAAIKGDKEQAKTVFLNMHKYLLFITCPMFVGIALIAQDIVVLFLGEKWLPIVVPLQILCIANVIRVSNQLVPRVLEGVGQPDASAKFQLLVGILCPIGMLIGSPFELVGIMTGWLVTLPIVYFFLFALAKRAFSVSFKSYFATVWPPIGGSVVMVFTVLLISPWLGNLPGTVQLACKITVAVLTYALFYLIFGRKDLRQIYRLGRNE